jgi:hypothetical protein
MWQIQITKIAFSMFQALGLDRNEIISISNLLFKDRKYSVALPLLITFE